MTQSQTGSQYEQMVDNPERGIRMTKYSDTSFQLSPYEQMVNTLEIAKYAQPGS